MSEGSVVERVGACALFPDWPLTVATTAISNKIQINMRISEPPNRCSISPHIELHSFSDELLDGFPNPLERILLLPDPQLVKSRIIRINFLSTRIKQQSSNRLGTCLRELMIRREAINYLLQARYDMYASKTSHRLVLAVIIVVLAVTTLAVGRGGLASAPVPTVQGPALRSMATMSGTVSSSKPFKAAQVYIRNVDMRIMYMVFTNGGQFRAVSLFPGNYEISVTAKGLKSDVRKLTLKAGENPKLTLSLQEAASSNSGDANPLQNLETLATSSVRVSFDTYENIYPTGPGRQDAQES